MEAMLRVAFLVLLAVLGTANSQQGQNFYYTSTDNRQQSRFLPFQQNQFSTVQQPFANYFPQTNAGPFLPFRSTGFQLGPDSNSAAAITSPQKFQNSQQYSVSPFQLPEQTSDIVSDPRYDPLISSPSLFGGTSNDDYIETSFPDQLQPQSQLPEVPSQRFNSPAQQSSAPSQQDRQSAHQQFRTSQLSRFSPVAISEVTRTQDTPNNPNGLQTHSFNVHHTTRHSADEVPVAQTQGRWRSGPTGHADGADFGYRGRNIPSAPPSSSPAAYQPFSTSRPVLPTAETPGNTESALSPFGKFNSRFGVAKEQTFIVNNQHPNVLELPEAQPDSDSTVSHYVPHGGYVPQPEKRKEFASKTKSSGGANRNANIPPTTFAPPIILDNRIRTTLPTTDISNDPVPTTIRPQSWPRGNHRGRNKYGRPTTETSVERWPKNAKPKGAFGSNASPDVGTGVLKQSTSSAEDNSNFEVVTMSQDHLFVSEDNFKGFVDSASIDSTESPITDDIKDTSEGATVATIAGHGKKKFVPTVATPKVETPEPRLTSTESTTERSHRKSSTSSTTTARSSETPSTSTEGWIIVASVQTSRSVSGARFIPSAAIKQEQHPLPLDSKSIKDLKTQLSGNKSSEHGSTDSTTTARTSSPKTSTVARSTSTLSTESIIDKLDQVQSDLSSGILSAFQSQDKSLMDMPGPTAASVRTTEATSTTDSGEERFSRKFVPSSKTTPKPKADRKSLFDSIHFEDPGNLLPPGFKVHSFSPKNGGTSPRTTRISESRTAAATTAATTSSTVAEKSTNSKNKTKSLSLASIKSKIKFDDVSQFLPPGYTPPPQELSSTEGSAEAKYHSGTSKIPDILSKAKPVDISNFLPPDFKLDSSVAASSTETSTRVHSLLSKISFKESNDLLPADYTTEAAKSTVEAAKSTSGGTKVVFPSRPGGSKKPPTNSPKSAGGKSGGVLPHQLPHIQKGWPTRATTEFAGWPSPSPSPISIEKVLQAAKEAATRDSNADSETTTPATTTTSTTPSTTTRPSTTPGICVTDCALLGSIRLTGGVKWVPELTEHNTKEYKTLANEVLHQLEIVFQSSEVLSRWYKMISIDSFSRGSVVVDFIVEPSELGRTVNTADMRRLFHDTLIQETITSDTFIPSTSNSSDYRNLKLGKFTVDSSYTYFSVIQKTATPVRAVESDVLLPQWAIAVIVIGLASLLFVLIFGITVVISRHKNSKKHPTALTEEMLNELNKSHMGGFENYAADDLYNMEDVWNEKPFKKRSSYYQEGSMPNIYDSWRSDWNGYYGNSYYNGSIRSGYSRRRSDYDTNF